jgi:hypothetical protein
MFNTRRNKVVANKTVGKILKSSGRLTNNVVIRIISPTAMFADSSMSISSVGSGTKITIMLTVIQSGRIKPVIRPAMFSALIFANKSVIRAECKKKRRIFLEQFLPKILKDGGKKINGIITTFAYFQF